MKLTESACKFACDEIAPVCCESALSDPYTWNNWCLAKCGANDFDSECDIRGSCYDLTNNVACTNECEEEWDPVCCEYSDGKYETVANQCMAKCKYPDTYGSVCGTTTDCIKSTSCCH